MCHNMCSSEQFLHREELNSDHFTQATKERGRRWIHLKTHGQGQPKSDTEGTSGPHQMDLCPENFKKERTKGIKWPFDSVPCEKYGRSGCGELTQSVN